MRAQKIWNSGPVLRGAAALALALWVSAWPGTAPADSPVAGPVAVADAAALKLALAAAGPGSVLVLAPGDYGSLILKDLGGTALAPITLRSADPAAPAVFATLEMDGSHDLVLQGLGFQYHFTPGDKPFDRPFQISDGQGITVTGCLFEGDVARGVSAMDDGFPTGFGLSLRNVTGVVLNGNEIRGSYRGLTVSDSVDVVVRGNDLHGIRMDGMDFAQDQKLLIEANHIHDFKRVVASPDHADMIQFWTNGTTKPSTDITIRDNILNSGKGWFTHSIFMRNEEVDMGRAGPEMFYRNITIENNVIINAHLHGITVGEAAGLTIARNSLIRDAGAQGSQDNPGLWIPAIRVAKTSTGVAIVNNVVGKIAGYGAQADWTVAGNFLIQDQFPDKPGYYDQVFQAARSGDPTDLASFAYRAGGPLDGTGLGASGLERNSLAQPAHR